MRAWQEPRPWGTVLLVLVLSALYFSATIYAAAVVVPVVLKVVAPQ